MNKFDLTNFPTKIQQIESRYRDKTGKNIEIIEVDDFQSAGNAVGAIFLNNCVAEINVRKGLSSTMRFQTICHEMLHLELSLQGYPQLEILSNDDNAKNLAAHLESLLQHQLIMPVEKSEFHYDPFLIEHSVANSLVNGFNDLTDFGSSTDDLWQFVYSAWAVSFVRVAILASDSAVFPNLVKFFERPEMKIAQNIASSLQQFIVDTDLSDSKKYIQALQIILNSHIKGNLFNGVVRLQVGNSCFQ